MSSLLLAVSVTFVAATLQGITGFGAGLISMSVLSSIWSVPQATAVMIPLAVLLNLTLMVKQYTKVNVSSLKWILTGIPIGVMIGILCLEALPETGLKAMLGAALLASVINKLLRQPTRREYGRLTRLIVGTCAGITGSALSAAGPPLLIFANLEGWSKDQFRAQLAVLFVSSALLTLICLSLRDQVNLETLSMSLSLTPGVIVGSLLGAQLGTILPRKLFNSCVLITLITLSARLLINAIP